MPNPLNWPEALQRVKALEAENKRLQERLQITPQGSDRWDCDEEEIYIYIDELEQALQFSKHQESNARKEIAQLREALQKAQAYLDVKKSHDNRLPELIRFKKSMEEVKCLIRR